MLPPIYVCIIYKDWFHAGNGQEMSSWMYNGQVCCLEHPSIATVYRKSVWSNIFPIHRMWMKCHLSCVRTLGTPPIQCIRNVKTYVLGKGNCAPYSYCIRKCPGNVQISCNKKCTYHEHEIWPILRISQNFPTQEIEDFCQCMWRPGWKQIK